MAQKVKFIPVLNEITDLSNKSIFIKKFELYSSIYSGLPLGYFDLVDESGNNFIDELENLQVGIPVKFLLKTNGEDEELDEDFSLNDYIIIKCEILGDENNDKPSGILRVWFGHMLFLYKDMKNRAYPAIDAFTLIKQIFSDESRGISFSINKKNFDEVDYLKKCRYKTLESDWEFMQNKIIPYCTNDKLPVFLYIDIENNICMHSFKSMMSSIPKIMFTPSHIDNEEDDTDFEEFKESNKTIIYYDTMKNINIYLSNDNALLSLRKIFYIEDSALKSVFYGTKAISNASSEKGEISKCLPISYAYGNIGSGSSIVSIRNHDLEDSVALIQSDSKYIDNFINVSFTSNFNTKTYKVGETIVIYIKKGHWLNGKWVITSVDISSSDENSEELIITYNVSRPTLNGSLDKTTLSFPEMLYNV